MTLGMRNDIARKVTDLLRELNENELTLLPAALQSEIDVRLQRAQSDLRQAERDLEKRQGQYDAIVRRFEVKP